MDILFAFLFFWRSCLQLAVLAVYVEDELLAVYHYFRSLAVEKPFPTTRENLTILFDKVFKKDILKLYYLFT